MRRFVVIGAVGVLAVAAAIGFDYWLGLRLSQPGTGTDGAAIERQHVVDAPASGGLSSPPPADVSQSAAALKPADPATAGAAAVPLPEFDVVRINPDGDAVIAGRAAPGAQISVLDGHRVAGTAQADARGEWVVIPTAPLPPGERTLRLRARDANGGESESESVVVLAVPERGSDLAGRLSEEPVRPLAVLVPRDGRDGPSKVLQKPVADEGVRSGNLSVDIVDYDQQGVMSIGGRGAPGSVVRLYVDNQPVGDVQVGDSGEWRLEPETSLGPGVHKLRADSLDGNRVVARVELPLVREGPLAEREGEEFIVVQPGNSLWRIARRTLGHGVKYAVIYEANREHIRDPNLIYPGQVFAIPRTE